MIQLIYGSTATRLLSSEELLEILHASQRNNERNGLTGMLLYAEGSFIQVLEGPESIVEATYARILSDPRHHNVMRFLSRPIETRSFSGWSMAFAEVSREACLQESGLSNLRDTTNWLAKIQPGAARQLLETFHRTSRS